MRSKSEAKKFRIEQARLLKGENPLDASSAPSKPDCCALCNGTGVYSGLLRKYKCENCHGSGLDVSDLIAVIEYQANQLNSARRYYKNLKVAYKELMNRYGAEKFKDEQLLIAMRGKDLKGKLD